jgi:hypothetical protein
MTVKILGVKLTSPRFMEEWTTIGEQDPNVNGAALQVLSRQPANTLDGDPLLQPLG